MANKVICPECGRDMRLIGGRNGDFYGCTGYPDKCKKTLSKNVARQYMQVDEEATSREQAKFVPSKYQQAFFDVISDIANQPSPHVVMEAVAGSGKTTTEIRGANYIPDRDKQRVIFVAFAKNIADTLVERLPPGVEARTTHSAAFQDVRNHLGYTPKIDEFKAKTIAERFVLPHLAGVAAQIVDKAKNTLSDTNFDSLEAICDKYDIDIAAELPENATDDQIAVAREQVYNAVPLIIERDAAETTSIDFTDMLWLPVYNNWPIRQFDWLLGDEVQDWNAGQIEWAIRAGNSGHILGIGDSRQSIFGFRGADTDAMDNLTNRLQAQVMPLSVCYRCPRSHIELAQQIVSQIEAAPNAKEGSIGWMKDYQLTSHDQRPRAGDLVLCRVNAPLVHYAYAFMREGIKVAIRGRNLGEGITALIKKLKPDSLEELIFKAQDYYHREHEKLTRKGKETRAHALTERIETLIALTDGIDNLSQLMNKINVLFNDQSKEGLIFSTVHRAKGDEAERVFILRPDLIPHPRAQRPDQMAQEMNLKYVSLSRAKDELWFVEKS